MPLLWFSPNSGTPHLLETMEIILKDQRLEGSDFTLARQISQKNPQRCEGPSAAQLPSVRNLNYEKWIQLLLVCLLSVVNHWGKLVFTIKRVSHGLGGWMGGGSVCGGGKGNIYALICSWKPGAPHFHFRVSSLPSLSSHSCLRMSNTHTGVHTHTTGLELSVSNENQCKRAAHLWM